MKTLSYDPSVLETDLANELRTLRQHIENHLLNNRITAVENHHGKDNPTVKFNLVDNDGDPHEIVVCIVQIPDKF